MNIIWHDTAWEDYLYWQTQDRRALNRVNRLIRDIQRGDDTGKPEPLRGDLSGWYSRRIDEKNRIVYRIRNGQLEITQCGGHYRDK